jgi:2-oxoglutarate ferredoxin oxidoreductase subunit alpha
VLLAFDLAFKYRNPAMILSDGVIGQMMEKVELFEQIPRNTEFDQSWVTTGRFGLRERNIHTSLDLDPARFEKHNHHIQKKYLEIIKNEIRFESILCDDADYIMVAYGSSARICQKTVKLAREKGIKAGLLRPITLFPFPAPEVRKNANHVKGFLAVELSAGQMVEDVRLAVGEKVPVEFYGRVGGMIPSPAEILNVLEEKFIRK